jgi:hypothetical protein
LKAQLKANANFLPLLDRLADFFKVGKRLCLDGDRAGVWLYGVAAREGPVELHLNGTVVFFKLQEHLLQALDLCAPPEALQCPALWLVVYDDQFHPVDKGLFVPKTGVPEQLPRLCFCVVQETTRNIVAKTQKVGKGIYALAKGQQVRKTKYILSNCTIDGFLIPQELVQVFRG